MDKKLTARRIALLGMMTALVFVSNKARITIPIDIGGQTSFTLANILCCLSGLILGPIGGLASGLGSALFDLTDPRFVSDSPITLITKGAMGLAAGLVVWGALKKDELTYRRALVGAVVGCVVYYILYFSKTFFYNGMLIQGLQPMAAIALLPGKIPASVFNGAIAIAAAPPLAIAIRAALKRSGLDRMLQA